MSGLPGVSRRRPDAIVVGGGVVGTSIAYRLAQAGKRVQLIERRGLASGASGRNGGMTGAGSAMYSDAGRAVYAITTANLELMARLSEELGADFELRLPGTLDVAMTQEQYDHLVESTEVQRANGIDVEMMDRAQAQSVMPALSDRILGAQFAHGRGHLWPFGLVHAFAAAAGRLGVEFRVGRPVERLLRAGDRVTGVLVDGEAIEADDIVLATNAYTPTLLPTLPKGAIVPARGQILVTQPVPPILPHPFGNNFDKEYGRQVPGGPILCGGWRRVDEDEGLGHYEERVSPAVLSGIASTLTTLFPALKEVRVVRMWAGIMGFTADGLPLIGRMASQPGLTLAAGFNGGGFSWAAMVGKLIAAELTGQSHGYDLNPFDPDRFTTAGTAWSNPFTAGEKSNPKGETAIAS
ncbi:MAG: FAD-binding oxidoreductase [Thermomicrobiales bacterium]|nr:FAD-binding oxidoreductase [Thermomicrobiales bacterium]